MFNYRLSARRAGRIRATGSRGEEKKGAQAASACYYKKNEQTENPASIGLVWKDGEEQEEASVYTAESGHPIARLWHRRELNMGIA